MSETQVKANIEEAEPTLEELEKMAAKQLLSELFMVQRRIYGIAMNSMLLVQLKQITRGLVSKYHKAGLFIDENIDVKFLRQQNTVELVPTPRLKAMFDIIAEDAIKESIEQNKEQENNEKTSDDSENS